MVLAISIHPAPSSNCHLVTVPVCPLRVRIVLLVPVQTEVLGETAPATVGGSTVIVAGEENAEGQVPFATSALKLVVLVRLTAV